MFTIFFAGKHFAPDLKIGDMNIQEFLQGYFAAMARVGANVCVVHSTSSHISFAVALHSLSLPLSL